MDFSEKCVFPPYISVANGDTKYKLMQKISIECVLFSNYQGNKTRENSAFSKNFATVNFCTKLNAEFNK